MCGHGHALLGSVAARRVLPILLICEAPLTRAELLTAFVDFTPTWGVIATNGVHGWDAPVGWHERRERRAGHDNGKVRRRVVRADRTAPAGSLMRHRSLTMVMP